MRCQNVKYAKMSSISFHVLFCVNPNSTRSNIKLQFQCSSAYFVAQRGLISRFILRNSYLNAQRGLLSRIFLRKWYYFAQLGSFRAYFVAQLQGWLVDWLRPASPANSRLRLDLGFRLRRCGYAEILDSRPLLIRSGLSTFA